MKATSSLHTASGKLWTGGLLLQSVSRPNRGWIPVGSIEGVRLDLRVRIHAVCTSTYTV